MTGKKAFSVVFLSLLLFFVFSPAYSAGKTIRFSWWGPESRHKATLAAIKIYEKRNPSVKIAGEYMDFAGYMERLVVQFSGGNEPDIMQVNWAWIETTLSKDGTNLYDLYNLKKYIKLDEFEGREKDGVVNGHLNGLPVSYTSRVVIWQKRTFQKAAVPYPRTWDDLFKQQKYFRLNSVPITIL